MHHRYNLANAFELFSLPYVRNMNKSEFVGAEPWWALHVKLGKFHYE